MRHYFRTLLSFTQTERRGLIVLVFGIILLLLVNLLMPLFRIDQSEDFSQWHDEMVAFEKKLLEIKQAEDSLSPFPFDPNAVSREELLKMNLPEKIVNTWMNYIAKGGKFKSVEDIQRIYGLKEIYFLQLKPFVVLSVTEKVVERTHSIRHQLASVKRERGVGVVKRKPLVMVDLNVCDSAALEELPGIGPVLSSRIIKYRKLLGGFYCVDQLSEVYGLRKENFQKALPYLTVERTELKQIAINYATWRDLIRHPYINKSEASLIISLRDSVGKLHKDQILEVFGASEHGERIAPYLKW